MSIREKFNIHSDKIVGMVARFHKRKDYHSFIAAAVDILKERSDVTFVTVGDGETLDVCKSAVPDAYKDNIRFLGRQEDIESIVNVFDVGVLVSRGEGISNSIMEYMALGKPVIASRHGGNHEIIEDGKSGFIVELGNHKELSEKINALLDNNIARESMGLEAKKTTGRHPG